MFVNEVNDVKIYNLSAGKAVPEWLTDRKKRNRLFKKVDSRRQIELIQDFDMPSVATTIKMSPDQQYILAAGTYKPRIKCFEVCNLSIKFERCFDSEITTFDVISDDYSKIALLQCDRYVEIHSAGGRHYRLRIPRFGLDMKYHKPSCDLFIVGTTKDIYRLNLERGQFLQPYETEASCLNSCAVNSEHGLLMVGGKEGIVEAWDPRTKTRCATLDVAMKIENCKVVPSVSTISFKNGLQMGVGTSSGHILLYDIRSSEPLLIKNHLNKFPIKRIAFNQGHQTVYSMDEAMLKLWDEQTGKQVAYIEAATKFNDFCTIPQTGLFFLAQEDVKMLTYYIPSMGPAPRWCSFLDNLTEEIESEVVENIYDDYQFITQKELEELGLENLIGTNLLKGYMHGYFIDARLYNKAKAVVEPFAFDTFRKEKIRQEIESERKSRLQRDTSLPKVNKELVIKIMEEQSKSFQNESKHVPSLLEDDRFKAMFENKDFEINKNAEEYKLLAPVINRLEKHKIKELKKRYEVAPVTELQAYEETGVAESDTDEDLFGIDKSDSEAETDKLSNESTDDENIKDYSKEMKKAYREVKRQRQLTEDIEDGNTDSTNAFKKSTLENENYKRPIVENNALNHGRINKSMKYSLHERVRKMEETNDKVQKTGSSTGNRQMTFEIQKKFDRHLKKRKHDLEKHREERRKLVRPVKSLHLKKVNFK